MTAEDLTAPAAAGDAFRQLFRDDGPATLALAAVTVALVLGVYALARWAHAGPREALLAALAANTAWVAMAAPLAAAAARGGWGALLRGGIVADASAIALLVLWRIARSDDGEAWLTFAAAVKIYCTYAAMALACIAAVACARTAAAKLAVAAIVAAVFLGVLAGPVWVGGMLRTSPTATAQTIAAWCVKINPFYSVASAVAEQVHFVWHQAPVMYRLTDLGDYAAPPPVAWYSAAWRYGAAAAVLALPALLRRKESRVANRESRIAL